MAIIIKPKGIVPPPSQLHVTPLFIDKLSMTIDVPKDKQPILTQAMKDFGAWKQGMHYALTCRIPLDKIGPLHLSADGTEETHLLFQAMPNNPDWRFLRVEFNPCKVDMFWVHKILEDFIDHWTDTPSLLASGYLTHLHWTVDILGCPIDSLLFWSIRKRWSEVKSESGRTIYLGQKTSPARFCLYDKAAEIKDKNAKKIPLLKEQVPKQDITRVELRLQKPMSKETPKRLLTLPEIPYAISNPFADLKIYGCIPEELLKEDELLRQTVASTKHEGFSAPMRRLSPKTRKKYLKLMDNHCLVEWWKPEEIWSQSKDAINAIINPHQHIIEAA